MIGLLLSIMIFGFLTESKGVLIGEALIVASTFLLWWYLFLIVIKIIISINQYIHCVRLVMEGDQFGRNKRITFSNSLFTAILPALFVGGAFLIGESAYPDLSMLGGYVYKYEKLISGIAFLIIGVYLQFFAIFEDRKNGDDVFFKVEDVEDV